MPDAERTYILQLRQPTDASSAKNWHGVTAIPVYIIIYTRFPSGKRLREWRKNETKSIQRETNTTTPEIEE